MKGATMKTQQAPVKPPEEFSGYGYESIESNEKRYEERKRLYPTPQADARMMALCAPSKPAPKARRKPAGF